MSVERWPRAREIWIGGVFGGVPIDWKHTNQCVFLGIYWNRLNYCICYEEESAE